MKCTSVTFKEMVVGLPYSVLITNHFVLLKGKLIGSERQMEAF